MAETAEATAKPGLIFVSIASYRDPQLVPTVRDCLDKARHPERLRFGICWQHASDEELPDWFYGDQFTVLDVDCHKSKGANWARAEVMALWDGEEWYLQLDSHHRFVPDWDVILLDEAAHTGTDRFVLTTYGPPFSPDDDLPAEQLPMSMQFSKFTPDGMLTFRPRPIQDWEQRTRPHRARFVSAHLLFAPGRFVRDVPCDPELYFTGDESTLGLRAFTHGYDLFEPSRLILWHEYSRVGRPKHWDDHTGGTGPAWYDRDAVSRAKIRQLYTASGRGPFGLGDERTLEEYEAYAGVSFRHRKVQDYTRQNLEPPNPPVGRDWHLHVGVHHVEIAVEGEPLSRKALEATQFWSIGIHDCEGHDLHRWEIWHDELAELERSRVDGQPLTLTASFESEADPAWWAATPFGENEGWLPPVVGTINCHRRIDPDEGCPARVEGITWESSGDRHIAHLPGGAPRRRELNSSGALLVELADGRHSVREIATYLREAHELDDDPVAEILEFYVGASSAGLVTIADRG